MRARLAPLGRGAALALLMACAQQGGQSVDSAGRDTGGARGRSAVAAPDTAAPRVGSNERPRTDKVVGSAGNASSAGGARVTGGPQRPPTPPRSSGCGGAFVNVTVRASALSGSTLERVAGELLAPVRTDVGAPSLSPAIRAFRVPVRDPSTTDRVVSRLRASPKAESVEVDGCEVMIER